MSTKLNLIDRLNDNFSHWRIAHRIWSISLLALALFMVSTSLGWYGLKKSRDSLGRVFNERAIPLQNLATLQKTILRNTNDIFQGYEHDPAGSHLTLHNDHEVSDHLNPIKKRKKLIEKFIRSYLEMPGKTKDEIGLANDLKTAYEAWSLKLDDALVNIESGDFNKNVHMNFLKAHDNELDILNEVLDGLIALQGRVAKEEFEVAENTFKTNQLIFISLLVGGSLFIFTAVLLTVGYIQHSLIEASRATDAIAKGDLTIDVQTQGSDELAEMIHKIGSMRAYLIEIVQILLDDVGKLKISSVALSGIAAKNIVDAQEQLKITSITKDSVSSLAFSIEKVKGFLELAHNITEQSGAKSQAGFNIISETSGEMRKIAESVNEMAITVNTLNEQSQHISGATETITDIVTQINLLALNASIEAARAGGAGRGFSIVADEVRKLSQKTAVVVNEITTTIKSIQEMTAKTKLQMAASVIRVNHGAELADSAGQSISNIQHGSEQVIKAVGDIDRAFCEQVTIGKSISDMIEQIAITTHHNMGSINNVAESATQMKSLSEELHLINKRFKIPYSG